MGARKDRNGMDLTEAEDIKKKWQECKEELQRITERILMTHMATMVWSLTLEPDSLECEL